MYKNYQPKSKNSIKSNLDCMIRSVCAVTDLPYEEIHKKMYAYGWRVTRRRSKGNWEDHIINTLNDFGYKVEKISFPGVKGQKRMTPKQLTKEYPNGKFIMNMAKHVCGVVEGKYLDSWDCGHKCVYYVWKITKK